MGGRHADGVNQVGLDGGKVGRLHAADVALQGHGVLAVVAGAHVDVKDLVEAEGAVAGGKHGLVHLGGPVVDRLDLCRCPRRGVGDGKGAAEGDAVAVEHEDGEEHKDDNQHAVHLAVGPPARQRGAQRPHFGVVLPRHAGRRVRVCGRAGEGREDGHGRDGVGGRRCQLARVDLGLLAERWVQRKRFRGAQRRDESGE